MDVVLPQQANPVVGRILEACRARAPIDDKSPVRFERRPRIGIDVLAPTLPGVTGMGHALARIRLARELMLLPIMGQHGLIVIVSRIVQRRALQANGGTAARLCH